MTKSIQRSGNTGIVNIEQFKNDLKALMTVATNDEYLFSQKYERLTDTEKSKFESYEDFNEKKENFYKALNVSDQSQYLSTLPKKKLLSIAIRRANKEMTRTDYDSLFSLIEFEPVVAGKLMERLEKQSVDFKAVLKVLEADLINKNENITIEQAEKTASIQLLKSYQTPERIREIILGIISPYIALFGKRLDLDDNTLKTTIDIAIRRHPTLKLGNIKLMFEQKITSKKEFNLDGQTILYWFELAVEAAQSNSEEKRIYEHGNNKQNQQTNEAVRNFEQSKSIYQMFGEK